MSKKLSEVKKNKETTVDEILTDEKIKRVLSNFGIKRGSKVTVISSNYGNKSYLVLSEGTTFAIDKSVLERVMVYE